MKNAAPTDAPIHDLLTQRWSPRAIDPERPVAAADLRALLEAVRWAPSTFNEQPWRYLVFDGSEPESLERARTCPVLLLSVARETFSRNDKPNRLAGHDVGLASENLALQATALGLALHQMGGFDAERARVEFHIPEGFTPMAMIAIGHPASADTLPEDLRERELAPRTRRPVGEIAFAGDWDRPFPGS